MITSVFKVKLIANVQDGISETQPDADFDESAGYSVGFVLLVEDGTTWICTDNTDTLAVWVQNVENDPQITDVIRKLTELIPLYCNQWWADIRYRMYISAVDFAAGALNKTGANFDASFYVGDTVWIENSRRNDGVYDVTEVTADKLTVYPALPFDGQGTETILLYAAVYPAGLQDIAARMAWFDVYVRPGRNPGLDSEAIGSYSYSKTSSIGDIEYPTDVTAGIMVYKRPKVM